MPKTLVISDETYEKIKDQIKANEDIDISSLNDLIGKTFFFRTVTYHLIGKVEKLIGKIAVLSEAVWVADSGRFMNAIKEGKLNEYEEIGSWFLNLDTVTDFGLWKYSIPKGQK